MPRLVPSLREGNVLRPKEAVPASLMTRVTASSYVYYGDDDLFSPDLPRELGTNVLASAVMVAPNFAGMHYHAQRPTIRYGVARNVDCAGCLWADVAPTRDTLRWDALDAFVASAAAAGRDIVYCFLATPGWASARPGEPGHYGAGSDAEPADVATLGGFATAVASRYRRLGTPIRAFEIWNEPKFDDGGGVPEGNYFTGTPELMARMARAIRAAVKAVDPNVLVLSPSPTGLEFHWFEGDGSGTDRLDRFLAAADGQGGTGAQSVDAVAFHAYSHNGSNNVHAIPTMVANVRDCLSRHGLGALDLWITETSAITPALSTYVPQRQQEYIARTMLLALGAGASRLLWYAWDDPLGFSAQASVAAFWDRLVAELSGAQITLVNSLVDRRVAAVVNGARVIF